MGPFGIPNEVPTSIARDIVAEFSQEILEKSAFVMGPQSKVASTLREAVALDWKCRVYKLRDSSLIVVPQNKEVQSP
jgi:hypothetical protein